MGMLDEWDDWEDENQELPPCALCGCILNPFDYICAATEDEACEVEDWIEGNYLNRSSVRRRLRNDFWSWLQSLPKVYCCDSACEELYLFSFRQEVLKWLEKELEDLIQVSVSMKLKPLLSRTKAALRANNLEACKSLGLEFAQLQILHR